MHARNAAAAAVRYVRGSCNSHNVASVTAWMFATVIPSYTQAYTECRQLQSKDIITAAAIGRYKIYYIRKLLRVLGTVVQVTRASNGTAVVF